MEDKKDNRGGWNKGLTKKTNFILLENSKKISKILTGKRRRPFSDEHRRNISLAKTGENNAMWKGGECIKDGYPVIINKDRTCNADRYLFIHRVRAESLLGRKLKKYEIVHHIDYNKKNNSTQNLHIFKNASEHFKCHKTFVDCAIKLFNKGLIKFEGEEYFTD